MATNFHYELSYYTLDVTYMYINVHRWSSRNWSKNISDWSKSKWRTDDWSKRRRERCRRSDCVRNSFGSSSRMSHRHKVSLSKCKSREGGNGGTLPSKTKVHVHDCKR